MRNKTKVIVIGIDGGTFDLILPWVKKGYLPNFEKLIKKGSWGNLNSGPLSHTAVCWSSFITGCNLGSHGINEFYVIKRDGNKNTLKQISTFDRMKPSLWSIITRQNKKVAVLNVPMTYPPEKVSGILVSGFQTPPNATDFTYPLSVKDKLNELVGGYSIYPQNINPETNLQKYLTAAYEVTDKQFKAVNYFLQKRDWDFFMYVFQQSDILQHFYWHFMDETHPQYSPDNIFKEAILGIYKKIDGYLGDILENLDNNTVLIIVSDHSAGPIYNRFWLSNWLMKEGYLKLKKNFDGLLRRLFIKFDICESDFFNFFLRDSFIGKMRSFFTGKQVLRKIRYFYSFKHIDWSKTKAYCLGYNQLSINLKGREPEGIVNRGKEYEELRDELIKKLKKIISPITHKQMMTEIYRKEELFHGELLDTLPDIIYVCDGFKTQSLGGYKIGSSKVMDKLAHRTADHRKEAIIILYGPPFKEKQRIEGAELKDLAPTILSLLQLDIPKHMDGRILKDGFINPQDVYERYVEMEEEKISKKEDIYSKEDTKSIEEKLKSLGYL